MKLNRIDINVDLGEGSRNDAILMPFISSCSIACGGHFGDEYTMKEAIQLAKKHHVKIGAHPSFPDKKNFGRALMIMTNQELSDTILFQLERFSEACKKENVIPHHIKLHGALYNHAAKNKETADAVVHGILLANICDNIYVPYNSELANRAKNKLSLTFEAFIDRRYNDDLSLVSRTEKDAVISDPTQAWNQLREMVIMNEVTTVQKNRAKVEASTYCLHGDNDNAVEILQYIRFKMNEYGINFL